ncbi:hypothetical protein SEPCBS119000_003056 [Sporothrix epigloea]|uniref:Guanine nucleotide exchange factor n=1 Tax=Sporothrix epigloea TaxID=1892477 RepID=A0ABP0DL89_9PEZI
MAQQLAQGGLTGAAKLKAVTDLINSLTQDLSTSSLGPRERDAALDELKVYARDPRNADPIFVKEGIETLSKHAFDGSSATTSRNALRCLANCLLVKPSTRNIFVDLGYPEKASIKLTTAGVEDEFLISRIIFLTTYGTSVNLQNLIDQHHLADAILQNLTRHVKLWTGSSGSSFKAASQDPMTDMALTETAKLLFNVTHFCRQKVDSFTPAIALIVTLICQHALPQPKPLDPPLGSLVNALLTLNLASEQGAAALFPKANPAALCERLIQVLDKAVRSYPDRELDTAVLPLITALRKIYELAPAEGVQRVMQAKLLPTTKDRKKVLGKGQSLASLILRHTTNAMAPEFSKAVSHMLFELSDKDATKFVQNVGYGFASGFLFQNNVPVPESVQESFQASEGGRQRAVNAITGQFIDKETAPELPEMTDEEKEREAERLFVLFERLKSTGVMNVENPVARAAREGHLGRDVIDGKDRVEELD